MLRRYPFNEPLKAAIWLYFVLLIFEGALRKWVLPSLSNPILIIRDPLAIWIFLMARQKGYLKFNPMSFFMILCGLIGFVTAITIGHGNLYVALFGMRIYVLQFPLIFAIGRIFDWEDVIKMGRAFLWVSLPMTLLLAVQFYSPQSSFVNIGVGGDTSGAGFAGALGYFRPPGTFSFTTGVSMFYGVVAAFVFYFWFKARLVKQALLIAATACLLIAIPLSISRSLFFEVAISITFSVVAVWRKPKYIGKILSACAVSFILYFLLRNQSFFATSTEAFNARFEDANASEGGLNGVLIDRFLGGMLSAIQDAPNLPFFGYGIGMGTNVGSQLLTGGMSFLISEEEWGRIIGEQGLLFGFIIIIIRVSFVVKLAKQATRYLKKIDALPWMLLSYAIIPLLQAQWGQPTALGFSVLSGGLILAAMNEPVYDDEEEEIEEPIPEQLTMNEVLT
jgi:hypothetical protein